MRDGEEKNNILILSASGNNYYSYSIPEDTIYGPYVLDGSYMICDAAVSGETAVISRFGDGLFFIDVTNPNVPEFIESVDIPDFNEEDIEITPNGRYVLVTDGGSITNNVYAVSLTDSDDVKSLAVSGGHAVAVTPDGETVLTADYYGGRVLVLDMDPDTGTLTDTNIAIEGCTGIINITISPDGETALAACLGKIVVISIDSPDSIEKVGEITLEDTLEQIQSIAYSPAGDKAYAVSGSGNVYELDVDDDITYSGRSVALGKTLNTYFGIDQMVVSSDGSRAYVGGQTDYLTVIDLSDMTIIDEIQLPPTGCSGIAIY